MGGNVHSASSKAILEVSFWCFCFFVTTLKDDELLPSKIKLVCIFTEKSCYLCKSEREVKGEREEKNGRE